MPRVEGRQGGLPVPFAPVVQQPSRFASFFKKVEQWKEWAGKQFKVLPGRVSSGVTKGVEKVTPLFVKAFLSGNYKAVNTEARSGLHQNTGSAHFSRVLSALLPGIVDAIYPKIDLLKQYGVSKEKLQELIEANLLHAMMNLSNKVKGKEKNHVFTNIILYVSGLLNKHLPKIDRQIQQIRKSEFDKKKELGLLQDVFDPLVEELLSAVFPKGAEDIQAPRLAKSWIWKKIQEVARTSMIDLYDKMMAPSQEKKKEQLGEALVHAVEQLSKDITVQAPKLISGQARDLAKAAAKALSVKGEKNTLVISHLQNRITELMASEEESVGALWDFITKHIDGGLVYALATALENSPEKEGSPIERVAIGILAVCGDFFTEHHIEIDKMLREGGNDQEIITKYFIPFAAKMKTFFGLDQKDQLPVPPLLRGTFIKIMDRELSKFLFKGYREIGLWKEAIPLSKDQDEKVHLGRTAKTIVTNMMPSIRTTVESFKGTIGKLIIESLNEYFIERHRLGKEEEGALTTLVGRLASDTENPHIAKAISFLQGYVGKALPEVFTALSCSYEKVQGLQEGEGEKGILGKAAQRLLHLSVKHLSSIKTQDLADRLARFNDMPENPFSNAIGQKLLIPFQPFCKEFFVEGQLKKVVGAPKLFQESMVGALQQTALPYALSLWFSEMMEVSRVRGDLEGRLLPMDGSEDVRRSAKVLAGLTQGAFLKYLKGSSVEFIQGISDALPLEKFNPDDIKKVAAAVKGLVADGSEGGGEAFGFIEKHIENALHHAIGNLALSAPEPKEGNVLANIIRTLVTVAEPHLEEFEAKNFAPFVKDIMTAAGFAKAQDLPAPNILQEVLYTFFQGSYIPDFLARIHGDMWPAGKKPDDHLDALSQVLMKNLLPMARGKLHKQKTVIAEKLAKSLPDGMVSGKTLEGGFELLTKESSPEVQRIYAFAERYIGEIISRAAGDFAGEGEGNPLTRATKNLFALVQKFFKRNKETLKAELPKVIKLAEGEAKDQRIERLFGELSRQILAQAGIASADDLSIPSFLKNPIYDTITKNVLPAQIFNLHQNLGGTQKQRTEDRKRLAKMLFDPKDLKGVDASKVLYELYRTMREPTEKIYEAAGTTHAVKQVENIASTIGFDIRGKIQDYLKGDAAGVAGMLNTFLNEEKLGDSEVQWIAEAIKDLSNDGDPTLKKVWGDLETIISSTIFKAFVNIADTADPVIKPSEKEHSRQVLVSNVLVQFVGAISHNFESIHVHAKKIMEINDPKQRAEKFRKVFRPLAKEFLNRAIPNPSEELQIPEALKDSIWKLIEEQFLPDMLSKAYEDVAGWYYAKDKEAEKLKKIFGTTHPAKMAELLGQYASDFLPHYLSTSHDQVGESLFSILKAYLLSSKAPAASEALKSVESDQEGLKNLFAKNVQKVAESQEEVVCQVWPATKEYMEAVMMRILARVGERVHNLEDEGHAEHHENFLLEMAIKLLNVMTDHFVTLTEIKDAAKKGNAFEVPKAEILKKFKGLHKGVPNDPKLSDEEKAKVRSENFFKPLTKDILGLAGINTPGDLPVPKALQQQIWDAMRDQLVPEVMRGIFETFLDPHSLNLLILNSLELFNAALEKIPEGEVQEVEDDAHQRELNKTCGELILRLIKMVPTTLAHSILKFDRVKAMTAETIGKAVRQNLKSWTAVQMLDSALYGGVLGLHTGEWKGEPGQPGQEKFHPKKVVLDHQGNESLEPSRMSFYFPKTGPGKKMFEAEQVRRRSEVDKKVKELLTSTISKQVKGTIQYVIKGRWKQFQARFDAFIKRHFGELGMKLKKVIDAVLRTIFFTGLGTLLSLVFYPLYKVGELGVDQYIKWRSKQILRNLHMPIHENLVYKMTEAFVGALKGS